MDWRGKFRDDDRKFETAEEVKKIALPLIRSNRFQPRESFDEEKIQELAQSIKTYGLLQPIIVTREEEGYSIVAGERRFMACKLLQWQEIPAIIRDYQGSSLAAVALIENLQRENLNIIEEAQGYKRLIEEFNLTQEVLAQRLGKKQSTIANKIRLLKLPAAVKELLSEGKLTERHARALLKLDSPEQQLRVAEFILEQNLNVNETEKLVSSLAQQAEARGGEKNRRKVVIRDLRIFLNTIRQAVHVIRQAGLNPEIKEIEKEDSWEIRITLPKKEAAQKTS